MPYALCLTLYALRLTPYALRLTLYALRLTPYACYAGYSTKFLSVSYKRT
jgi:hypothetical protein